MEDKEEKIEVNKVNISLRQQIIASCSGALLTSVFGEFHSCSFSLLYGTFNMHHEIGKIFLNS